jgi:ATP-binding cassette, subfamily B, bacterial
MARRGKAARKQPGAAAGKRAQFGSLFLIWRFIARYKLQVGAAFISLVLAAGATLAIPSAFRLIVDHGFGSASGDIGRWFEYLMIIVVVMALSTACRFYFVSWLGERVVADVRVAVQRNLLRLEPGFFEENRPSEIASRLTADTTIIEQVVGTTVSIALRNLLMCIGGTIYLLAIAPRLTGSLLIGIPVIMIPISFFGRRVRAVSRHSQDRVAAVGAMIDETLGAMKVVQAFGQEQREAERFSGAVEQVFTTAKRRILMRAVMTALVISLLFGSIAGIMWQGALDVQGGRISGGVITAFVITGGLVAGAFGALTEVYGDLLRGAGAASRLAELLAQEPAIRAPAAPRALPQPPLGTLAFDQVSFRYPTRKDVSALADFSLEVARGETVALVGPSGAGKSTLFQLAQRFYDPHAGAVRLDGVDLREADPGEIRGRLALVPQETIIFAASARDNLRYGDWAADDARLWAAAEAANAADFLRALPDGLDTYLGEGGARLSGGQRQRVAIARALLRDAPILLLDEATSALDAESERLVQQSLERLFQSRTTLVIAHRLATVRAADRIIVMDHGRIVEEGTHDALSARSGLYARLARLQFEGLAA